MRVALLKPDHGGTGGFERLLRRAVSGLDMAGHDVTIVGFDAATHPTEVLGIDLTGIGHQHPEFFLDMARVVRMDRLDLSGFDAVVATQPPTYLAHHPALVALCFHQARIYYDLADDYVAAGFVDARLHADAVTAVRAIDDDRIGGVGTWLTGSDEVARRLASFWGILETTAFRARAEIDPAGDESIETYDPAGPVLCVSRHEWPKRTELVAQAGAVTPDRSFEFVGGGTRLAWMRSLLGRYEADPSRARTDGPIETWQNRGTPLLQGDEPSPTGTRITLLGEVDDRTRDAAYDRAGVVVAPALREDYGLTVIEAWSRGRPVVVCDDGGGLVELVDHAAGLVVEPTARGIAEGCARLRDDPDLARSLAATGLARARALAESDDLAPLIDAVAAAI